MECSGRRWRCSDISRKRFFFEKKNQKTFVRLSRRRQKGPQQRSQKFLTFFLKKRRPYFFAAARTSAACPSTFTFGQALAIFPSAPTRNVERSMPMYFFPYMDFSTHTP